MDLIEIHKKFKDPTMIIYTKTKGKFIMLDGEDLLEFETFKLMEKHLWRKYRNTKFGCMPKIRLILRRFDDGEVDYVEWSLHDFLKRP